MLEFDFYILYNDILNNKTFTLDDVEYKLISTPDKLSIELKSLSFQGLGKKNSLMFYYESVFYYSLHQNFIKFENKQLIATNKLYKSLFLLNYDVKFKRMYYLLDTNIKLLSNPEIKKIFNSELIKSNLINIAELIKKQ